MALGCWSRISTIKELLQPGCVRKKNQIKINLDVHVVSLTVTDRSGSGSSVKCCPILPSIVCMVFGVVPCGFILSSCQWIFWFCGFFFSYPHPSVVRSYCSMTFYIYNCPHLILNCICQFYLMTA